MTIALCIVQHVSIVTMIVVAMIELIGSVKTLQLPHKHHINSDWM